MLPKKNPTVTEEEAHVLVSSDFNKRAKHLLAMLVEVGDLGGGRSAWEESLKAFTYYFFLLSNICMLWTAYTLLRYGVFSYQTSYPWDQTTVHGWLAAFQLSFLTASYTALIHTCVDSVISVSCGTMIGHLLVVQEMLRSVGSPGNLDHKTIVAAVRLHVKIIRAAGKMNYCFNSLFAIQSVYTVLHACVIIFAFTKAQDILAAFSILMPMLTASYIQLLIYCFFSQKLTSKFDEMTFASYDNKWYRCSLAVRKALVMFSIASGKQVALRGLGSSKASFASYVSSVQESISYYLILKTITAGEKKG